MGWDALHKIRAAYERRPQELAEARAHDQRVVGWIGYNVPEELIYACGMIPVRLARGGDGRLAEIGANIISTQNCFFLRQCVGRLAEGSDVWMSVIDTLAVDTTCVQLYRVASLLEYRFGVKVLALNFPKDPQMDSAKHFFAADVQRIITELEALARVRLEADKLQKAIALYRETAETVRELFRHAGMPGARLRWLEVFDAVQAGFVHDRAEFLTLLREWLQEIGQVQTEVRAMRRVSCW